MEKKNASDSPIGKKNLPGEEPLKISEQPTLQECVEGISKHYPVQHEVIRKTLERIGEIYERLTMQERAKLAQRVFAISMRTGVAPKDVLEKIKNNFE